MRLKCRSAVQFNRFCYFDTTRHGELSGQQKTRAVEVWMTVQAMHQVSADQAQRRMPVREVVR